MINFRDFFCGQTVQVMEKPEERRGKKKIFSRAWNLMKHSVPWLIILNCTTIFWSDFSPAKFAMGSLAQNSSRISNNSKIFQAVKQTSSTVFFCWGFQPHQNKQQPLQQPCAFLVVYVFLEIFLVVFLVVLLLFVVVLLFIYSFVVV